MSRHPEVEVTLTGTDGNAFAILGAVQRAMRNAGLSDAEISEYHDEATSGDYDHLIQTTLKTVTVN